MVYPEGYTLASLMSELPFYGNGKYNDGLQLNSAATDRSCTKDPRSFSGCRKSGKGGGQTQRPYRKILADDSFGLSREAIEGILKPENFIGRAPQQTEEFIVEYVKPILSEYADETGVKAELTV